MPRIVAAPLAAPVRSQAAVIAGSSFELLIVEALITGLTTGRVKRLSAGATSGLLQTGTWLGPGNLAPVGFGAVLLTTYAVVLARASVRISRQRELV
jgi:hypothetical protein